MTNIKLQHLGNENSTERSEVHLDTTSGSVSAYNPDARSLYRHEVFGGDANNTLGKHRHCEAPPSAV